MKEPESGISYKISGNSNSYLVLLHGYCETGSLWDHFVPPLEDEHTVLIPDLPGFGESDLIAGDFSIDDVADQLILWLSNLNVKKFKVVGHSLGGYIVMSLAERYADKLSGIGLFHSTSFADSAEKKANRSKAVEFINSNGVAKFASSLIPGLFYRKEGLERQIQLLTSEGSQCSPEAVTGYALAMRNRPDRREILYNFDSPVLFIAGSEDGAIAKPDSELQIKYLKDPSHATLLDQVGHMGMFEEPQVTLSLLKQFARSS